MPKLIIKSAYNHPKTKGISFLDGDGKYQPGKTKQAFKEESDINNIVKKYGRTYLSKLTSIAKATYPDNTSQNEYQESLDLVRQSQESFNAIPSAVRKQFNNDPGEFLEFVSNPDNKEKMIEYGLMEAPIIAKKPEPVEVINVTPETGNNTE